MSEVIDIVKLFVPGSSVRIELLFVIILGFLFWIRSKNAQIHTLKGQMNFLIKINTENFIERLIEREKNKDKKLEKLEEEFKQLQSEEETETIIKQKLVKEKERQIRVVQSSAEATTSAINSSLDYYNAGINTMGLIFNLRKELKEETSTTANEWKSHKEKNKRRKWNMARS